MAIALVAEGRAPLASKAARFRDGISPGSWELIRHDDNRGTRGTHLPPVYRGCSCRPKGRRCCCCRRAIGIDVGDDDYADAIQETCRLAASMFGGNGFWTNSTSTRRASPWTIGWTVSPGDRLRAREWSRCRDVHRRPRRAAPPSRPAHRGRRGAASPARDQGAIHVWVTNTRAKRHGRGREREYGGIECLARELSRGERTVSADPPAERSTRPRHLASGRARFRPERHAIRHLPPSALSGHCRRRRIRFI